MHRHHRQHHPDAMLQMTAMSTDSKLFDSNSECATHVAIRLYVCLNMSFFDLFCYDTVRLALLLLNFH